MKAEKRSEEEEIYPQMTPIYTDREVLDSRSALSFTI